MMSHPFRPFAMLLSGSLLLLSLSACAVKSQGSLVVLTADPGGKVGEIAVSNRVGTQIIAKPNYATAIKDSATPPTPPIPMEEKEIKRIFSKALDAQPEPPVTYILYFKQSSDLTEESTKQLSEILATVKERKSLEISIVGHTDTVGPRQKNYELALERAGKIKEILTSKGIDPSIIEIDSHGMDNLLIKTPNSFPEPRNRRVEVTIR
jgi:outer membrane protein OmpA-like peptidoglycan-associated protein